MAQQLDYHWIMPNMAQGSYPEPPLSAFKDFDILVLCAKELQSKSTRAPNGKHLVRLPMEDDIYRPVMPKDAQRYHGTARELAKAVMRGKKVLVTCAQGVNRSGLITSLIVMNLTTLPGRDVVRMLRQRRKVGGGAYPLMNPMFESFVVNARR